MTIRKPSSKVVLVPTLRVGMREPRGLRGALDFEIVQYFLNFMTLNQTHFNKSMENHNALQGLQKCNVAYSNLRLPKFY